MNLKQKFLAAGLAAIIAGFGILGTSVNVAQAQTNSSQTNSTIAQMMQIIESLKQQIQQLIALITQLKPLETCGNGICRFGETAASCAADCGQKQKNECKNTLNQTECVTAGGIYSTPSAGGCLISNGQMSCGAATANCQCPTANDNGKAKCNATGGGWKYSDCASGCVYNTKAERVAGGKTCATVCVKDYTCECAAGKYWASREEGCANNIANTCGDGICGANENFCPLDCPIAPPAVAICGNGTCETGETAASCPADCGTTPCAKEAEKNYFGSPICCAGLTPISSLKLENYQCVAPLDGSAVCAKCGNGVCGAGENKCNCPADCGSDNNCKNLWWTDNTHKFCQQKQFCGACMYLGLNVYSTQSACQAALANTCGDGICGANENFCPLDCPIAPPAVAICGNGACETGETAANCAADCAIAANPLCAIFNCSGSGAVTSFGNNINVAYCDGVEKTRVTCPSTLLGKLGKTSEGYQLCCDSVCGDNICELGETASGCPADCAQGTLKATVAGVTTTYQISTQSAKASLTAQFNVMITADGGDIYLPVANAFISKAVKNGDQNSANWISTSAVYSIPASASNVSNLIKVPRNTTATFKVDSTYVLDSDPGTFDLRIMGINWTKGEGQALISYTPTIPALWISNAVYLR